jgi:hypothetical protein
LLDSFYNVHVLIGTLSQSFKKRESEPLMKNIRLAQVAGIVGLVGGVVQIIYGLLAIPYAQAPYGWAEVLWAFAMAGMMGGTIGLLALDVARPRWLALLGAAPSIIGSVVRIVASTQFILSPSADPIVLILLSIALLFVGMCTLGIATLVGKQLSGWQAWLPLLAGACVPLLAAMYSLNIYLHFILLGAWGILWLLIAYTVYSRAALPKAVTATAQVNTS